MLTVVKTSLNIMYLLGYEYILEISSNVMELDAEDEVEVTYVFHRTQADCYRNLDQLLFLYYLHIFQPG